MKGLGLGYCISGRVSVESGARACRSGFGGPLTLMPMTPSGAKTSQRALRPSLVRIVLHTDTDTDTDTDTNKRLKSNSGRVLAQGCSNVSTSTRKGNKKMILILVQNVDLSSCQTTPKVDANAI
jgi:hypothetical protein